MRDRRPLLVAIALLVLAAGGYGYTVWSRHATRTAALQQLLADVEDTAAAPRPDTGELSRLMAKLDAQDPADRRVRLAQARIEMARGRWERAAHTLEPLVQVGGDAAELRAAARCWLMWHARGGKDAHDRAAIGRQALQFAENAYALGHEVEDLFRCWQAAVRLPDQEAAQRHAAALNGQFADSRETATVQLCNGQLQQPLAPVEALLARWEDDPPLELLLLRAVLQLQAGDIDAAVQNLDLLLGNAPNIVEVRNFAATVHHAWVGVAPGPERDRHLKLRDEQISWLDANAAIDDVRRAKWMQMRQQH